MTKRYRIFAVPFLRKWLIVRCVANTQATESGGGVFRTGGRTSEGALPPYPLRYPRRQDQKPRKMILSPDRWLGGRRENAQNCRLPQNLVWLFWSRRVGSRCREGLLSNSGSLPFRVKRRLCCGTRPLGRCASNGLRQSSHYCVPALLPLPGCRRLPSSWPTKVGHLLLKPPAPASFASRAAPPRHLETLRRRPTLFTLPHFCARCPFKMADLCHFCELLQKVPILKA